MARRELAFHEDLRRTELEPVQGSSDRAFGLVFAAVFAVIGFWPILDLAGVRWWALGLSGAFVAVALLRPGLLHPLNRVWTAFGLLLHRVVNPLVMALLFVLAIIPVGLLLRLSGKDPLRLRWDRHASSYWIGRVPPGPAPDTMKRQF